MLINLITSAMPRRSTCALLKTMLGVGLLAVCNPLTVNANATGQPQGSQATQQHDNTVKGKVVDENGEPLIGVTVRATKGNAATITDVEGNYTLHMQSGAQVRLSYTGYKDKTVAAGGVVKMDPDEQLLNEVVVVGYGVQRKSDVTGSLIRVSEKDLNSRPVGNALEAMQGKAAGVAQ